uniref:RING-type domain-containing protein n=1 Tax=Chromera velia CCMP2878 TaxID=1169474 RepID=A0A0G4HAW4_9ALVE|eukprot:Cvel_25661.t1-p1 / transcript=Cvel_25661.t1 / gene=Cvel_25661 / organism=Chromera_velia_CCMP2878 / gene_product=E3 ubiquitin-protein ligase RNF138, putative / transcript_product=E3 ubiquitin-protein ligase RNF138, putative / location=Cvel_scaffold2939:13955-15112(-) / protein_length=302 / sequence_SO=supercontig / SO=protein_coding / is_pseudo=false
MSDVTNSEFECAICLDIYHMPTTLPECGHSFCEGCLDLHLQQMQKAERQRVPKAHGRHRHDRDAPIVVPCPLCRTESRTHIEQADRRREQKEKSSCASRCPAILSFFCSRSQAAVRQTESERERQHASPFMVWRDPALMKKMSEQSISCECAETVSMDKYVEHRRSGCSSACKESSPKVGATMADELAALASSPSSLFRSSASSTSAGSSGRGGYRCPYCRQGGFDCRGLLSHCETAHPGRDDAAVCPICVSREDGDPSRVSRHWVSHMRLRHRFEPEDYVEDEDEEDAILQRVLQASLTVR